MGPCSRGGSCAGLGRWGQSCHRAQMAPAQPGTCRDLLEVWDPFTPMAELKALGGSSKCMAQGILNTVAHKVMLHPNSGGMKPLTEAHRFLAILQGSTFNKNTSKFAPFFWFASLVNKTKVLKQRTKISVSQRCDTDNPPSIPTLHLCLI